MSALLGGAGPRLLRWAPHAPLWHPSACRHTAGLTMGECKSRLALEGTSAIIERRRPCCHLKNQVIAAQASTQLAAQSGTNTLTVSCCLLQVSLCISKQSCVSGRCLLQGSL